VQHAIAYVPPRWSPAAPRHATTQRDARHSPQRSECPRPRYQTTARVPPHTEYDQIQPSVPAFAASPKRLCAGTMPPVARKANAIDEQPRREARRPNQPPHTTALERHSRAFRWLHEECIHLCRTRPLRSPGVVPHTHAHTRTHAHTSIPLRTPSQLGGVGDGATQLTALTQTARTRPARQQRPRSRRLAMRRWRRAPRPHRPGRRATSSCPPAHLANRNSGPLAIKSSIMLRSVRLGHNWSEVSGRLVDGSVCLAESHSAIAS